MIDTSSSLKIDNIQPYLLGDLASRINAARRQGRDIIDLSQVNPDIAPPSSSIETMVQAVLRPNNHRYSSSQGISKLRSSLSNYYQEEFSVSLDPDSEVVATMGSKEGLLHLLLAVLESGENVLLPTPHYPIHTSAVFIARGSTITFAIPEQYQGGMLTEDSEGFFDTLHSAYSNVLPRPRFLIVSFPHNPTTTIVDESFFTRLVAYARKHKITIIHDFAYSTLCYEDYRSVSILQVQGAKDVAVEMFSMSKSFSIPGWRVGFLVGNSKLVAALKKIKSYADFGIFQPIQIASVDLLENSKKHTESLRGIYKKRRDALVKGLDGSGLEFTSPKASLFLWAKMPKQYIDQGSMSYAYELLDKADVAACPGCGFGQESDSYVRFALVESEDRLQVAAQRIAECMHN